MDANSFAAHNALGWAYAYSNRYDDAIREMQEAVRLSARHPTYLGTLCSAYALAGKRPDALKVLEELKAIENQRYVRPWSFMYAYMGLKDHDKAIECLRKGYEIHDDLIMINVERILEPVRSDSRFQEIVRKMNFPTK